MVDASNKIAAAADAVYLIAEQTIEGLISKYDDSPG